MSRKSSPAPESTSESTTELWERNAKFLSENFQDGKKKADVVLILRDEGIEIHDMAQFPLKEYMRLMEEAGITAEARCLYCG